MESLISSFLATFTSQEEAVNFVKFELFVGRNGPLEFRDFIKESSIDITSSELKHSPKSLILTRSISEFECVREIPKIRAAVIDAVMQHYKIGKYEISQEKDKIKELCIQRGIKNLVHFTKRSNLNDILWYGIKSKKYNKDIGKSHFHNDEKRLDGRLDWISTSIQFPNYKMFYKYRCQNKLEPWVVLLLCPSIIWSHDCLYCPSNAASHSIRQSHECDLRGPAAFEKLFDTYGRNLTLRASDPSDVQAEVLVKHHISPNLITRVVFEKKDDLVDNYSKDFIVDQGFFLSRDNFLAKGC